MNFNYINRRLSTLEKRILAKQPGRFEVVNKGNWVRLVWADLWVKSLPKELWESL